MVVMGDLDRAAMEMLPVDLMVEMVKVVKDRTKAQETMEDLDRAVMEILLVDLMVEMAKGRTKAMDTRMGTRGREATEDHKTVQALTMVLASRTQASSHKSTCTQRS